jgi:hypothetical protein
MHTAKAAIARMHLSMWIKGLFKQREGNMNTIQITTVDGAVNYTESEVTRYIEKAGQVDKLYEEIRKIRYEVRDFFSEGEWSDGETTVNKGDTNALLERIGAQKLTTKYRATYTITGSFSVEVEDEDDVESLFTDNVNVDFYDGDIDVDQIEVLDIEEDN